MVWPASTVDTTNFDEVTDSPALARLQLLEAVNDIKAILEMRGVANGIADLDANARIPVSRLYTNVANGLNQLDSNGDVPVSRFNTNAAGNPVLLGADSRIGYARDRFVALAPPGIGIITGGSWAGTDPRKGVWQTVSNATLSAAGARRALLFFQLNMSDSANLTSHGHAYGYIRKTGSGAAIGDATRACMASHNGDNNAPTTGTTVSWKRDSAIVVALDASSRFDYALSWDNAYNGGTISPQLYVLGYWL